MKRERSEEYYQARSIKKIERMYLTREPGTTYIALEGMELAWDKSEVEHFIYLWNEQVPLEDIAVHFNRSMDEAAILLFDLSMNEKVKPRKNGIF